MSLGQRSGSKRTACVHAHYKYLHKCLRSCLLRLLCPQHLYLESQGNTEWAPRMHHGVFRALILHFGNTFDKFCFHSCNKHLCSCHIIKSNSEESGLNIFYLILTAWGFVLHSFNKGLQWVLTSEWEDWLEQTKGFSPGENTLVTVVFTFFLHHRFHLWLWPGFGSGAS